VQISSSAIIQTPFSVNSRTAQTFIPLCDIASEYENSQ